MEHETTTQPAGPVAHTNGNALPPSSGPPRSPAANTPRARRKKQRNITKNVALQKAVVRETFFADGKPSYVSAGQVAKKLGLNIPAVVAILAEAFRKGLFQCVLNMPYEEVALATLTDRVKTMYGLRDVVLVPGDDAMLAPSSAEHRQSIHQETIKALVSRCAKYLDDYLAAAAERAGGADKVACRVGVAWGYTLQMLAAHLRNTQRPITTPSVEVVPIIGLTGVSYAEGVEANTVAADLARCYHSHASQLPCCAFVEREHAATEVKRQRQVGGMLRKIADCDLVLTGMGRTLAPDAATKEDTHTRLANDVMLSGELATLARSAEAIAEICYWLVNEKGEEVTTKYEAIGLGYHGLRKIAANAKKRVVLITGGDAGRFEPLKAILKARLVSVLIIDTVTAKFLVGEL